MCLTRVQRTPNCNCLTASNAFNPGVPVGPSESIGAVFFSERVSCDWEKYIGDVTGNRILNSLLGRPSRRNQSVFEGQSNRMANVCNEACASRSQRSWSEAIIWNLRRGAVVFEPPSLSISSNGFSAYWSIGLRKLEWFVTR